MCTRIKPYAMWLALLLGLGIALCGIKANAAPPVRIGNKLSEQGAQPPTNALCESFGFECLGPADIRAAYGLNPLIDAGFTGAGETIVIIDAYGSPTIAADLHQFDVDYGIPDPPSFKVLAPLGTVPFDPTQPDQVGWAYEVTLDVEWAHAVAPGASIVLLTSPVDETQGVQGLPEFLRLEQYALEHHLGKIFSQSWAATENTLFRSAAGPEGPALIAAFNRFYEIAAAEGVTVLASAGDTGSQNAATYSAALGAPTSFYTSPTVNFPASSPWVTSVGGTALYLDANDEYLYETVWNDDSQGFGAGGGGVSELFDEPFYQAFTLPPQTQRQLRGHRGIPDVAYNADDFNSPILIYLSFLGEVNAGYYFIGGTSEGSPQWAGIVADLNQLAGFPLGFLNPKLYALGRAGQLTHFGRDITQGNNSYAGVAGYSAAPGWDPASGWGTPNLGQLLKHWSSFINATSEPTR
jgi:subtilase family serine protease